MWVLLGSNKKACSLLSEKRKVKSNEEIVKSEK